MADFDRDGRVDIYQTNMAQPSLFYRNLSSSVGHWIALQLVGTDSNRDAVGARVTVRTGHSEQVREVSGGNGYSGQSSKILHFGLGPEKSAEITVRWPSGLTESTRVPIDQLTVVREGQGKREGNLSDRR